MNAAGYALRVTATRPIWLVPAILFLAILFGVGAITAVGLISYAQTTANANPAFYQLVYTAMYTLEATPGSQITAKPPDAFLTPDAIPAMMKGVWTIQYAGIALILLSAILILVASYSYMRALVLGLVRDTHAGVRTNLFSMFRAAREYWWPSFRYAVPFGLLLWIGITVSIPLLVQSIAQQVVGVPGFTLGLFTLIVLTLGTLFSAITVLGEIGMIDGSRKPIRDSIIAATLRPLRTIGVIAVTLVAAIIVLVLDYLRSILSLSIGTVWVSTVLFIVFLLIASAWRVWAMTFVASLSHAGNQRAQMPHDE